MTLRHSKLVVGLRKAAQTIRQLGNAQLSLVKRALQEQPSPNVIYVAPTAAPRRLHMQLLNLEADLTIQLSKTPLRAFFARYQLPTELVVSLGKKELTVPLRHAPMLLRHRESLPLPKRMTITLLGKQFQPPLKPQTALSIGLVIFGLIGTLYFGLAANKPAAIAPPSDTSAPIPAQVLQQHSAGLSRSAPTLLSIDSIGVKTSLIKLGQNKDGSMEVPKAYDVAGWYKYAPTPGQIGPAIIVGHVDSYRGAAVFFRLKELKRGAIIKVKRADGKTVKFKVNTVKQFYQNKFPTKQVYGNLNYPGLRLITCGGQFSQQTLQYNQNTVVYASIVR